ncbi:MAG: dTMP kinase [Kofleriaceae bacterium]
MTNSPDHRAARRATLIVFEGIDGSGKTTLSNALAGALRARGQAVTHVREGGRFASTVTQAVRELGRDARNLAMTPWAELFVYLAREIQLLEEATAPALATADVVIADRFFYTAELLATSGRGVPAADVAPVVAAARGGLEPDLVVLVDVDPFVARARRKVSKQGQPDARPPSRKGQAGVGLQHRLRDGYLARAAAEPARWLVVDNTAADLDELVGALVAAVAAAGGGDVAAARACLPTPVAQPRAPDLDLAAAAFGRWIDQRQVREPALAAHLLGGLAGADWDARRLALVARAPLAIAGGLGNQQDEVSWQLRGQLEAVAPGPIVRSYLAATSPLAITPVAPARQVQAAARATALAPTVPADVARALRGRDDDLAWQLRADLDGADLVRSVAGLDGERAWAIRRAWLAQHGEAAAWGLPALAELACATVAGVPGAEAWAWRRGARAAAPVAALAALAGLDDERAWRWRARWLARAPRTVLGSVAASDDDQAWALRHAAAERCPEALDSIRGLDGERAWALRRAHAGRWALAAARSLGPLALTAAGAEFLTALLVRFPDSPGLWRTAAHAVARGARGPQPGASLAP